MNYGLFANISLSLNPEILSVNEAEKLRKSVNPHEGVAEAEEDEDELVKPNEWIGKLKDEVVRGVGGNATDFSKFWVNILILVSLDSQLLSANKLYVVARGALLNTGEDAGDG